MTPDSDPETSNIGAYFYAGAGGTCPALCTLAASAVQSNPQDFSLGVANLVGCIFYFVVGAFVCRLFQSKRRREAFFIGISAPAMITSSAAGYSSTGSFEVEQAFLGIIPVAYAQVDQQPYEESSENGRFWREFKRTIGFNVAVIEAKEQLTDTRSELERARAESRQTGEEIESLRAECVSHSVKENSLDGAAEHTESNGQNISCDLCRASCRLSESASTSNADSFVRSEVRTSSEESLLLLSDIEFLSLRIMRLQSLHNEYFDGDYIDSLRSLSAQIARSSSDEYVISQDIISDVRDIYEIGSMAWQRSFDFMEREARWREDCFSYVKFEDFEFSAEEKEKSYAEASSILSVVPVYCDSEYPMLLQKIADAYLGY